MKDHEEGNISNYIDVSNVLDLALEGETTTHHYIDPSIASTYREQQQQQQQQQHKELEKQQNEQSSSSSNPPSSDSLRIDLPGVPRLPLDSDPKKMCPFCQRTFSHPGSLGRHLDLKKGTQGHPAEIIAQMRAEVKRRGDKELVKRRRRERARTYNAREDVRERTKVQRRVRERILRAKKTAMVKFTNQLGRPQLQPHPTFARLVLYFLPPDKWPHDPPTLETHRLLCDHLNQMFLSKETRRVQRGGEDDNESEEGGNQSLFESVMAKVSPASDNWLSLGDSVKQEIWIRELRRAAEDALNNTSLYQLKNRDDWITKEAHRAIFHNEDSQEEEEDEEEDENNESNENSDSGKAINEPQQNAPLSLNPRETTRQPRSIVMKGSKPHVNQAIKPSTVEHIFNREDLATVAELASVDNDAELGNSHLDPQLMSR